MRLVTWNCCRGDYRAKLAALEPLAPDVVVLQEAPRPAGGVPDGHLWLGDNPRVGVVVAGFNGFRVEQGPETAVHAAYPVRVNGPVSFHLLAVWTKHATRYLEGLATELDRHREFLLAAPAVVAGDFNSNSIWDKPRRPVDHSRMVGRLREEFGMVSAYHEFHGVAQGGEPHPTYYFQWQESKPFHIDYCFVPRGWGIIDVQVGDFSRWSTLSDHRPLIVDVRLERPIERAARLDVDLDRTSESIDGTD